MGQIWTEITPSSGSVLVGRQHNVGHERLEAACIRALAIGVYRYRSVASILDKGLDRQPLNPPEQAELALPDHANVRGPTYYH